MHPRTTGTILALAFAALAPSLSRADAPQIQLGQPTLDGNGCPAGTASAALSPDGSELSVLFDRFIAAAGGDTGLRHDRKTCMVDIPITLPDGYSAAVVAVDYRGFMNLPNRAQGEFQVDYTYGSRPGPRFLRRYIGPRDEQLEFTQKLRATDVTWSGCGGQTRLRLVSSMLVTTNGDSALSQGGLDSSDVSGGVVYEVQYKQCAGAPAPQPTSHPTPVPGGPVPPRRPVGPDNPGPMPSPAPSAHPAPRPAPTR